MVANKDEAVNTVGRQQSNEIGLQNLGSLIDDAQ